MRRDDRHIRRSPLVVLTILLGVAYPLVTYGVSQAVFPGRANGELSRSRARSWGRSGSA